MVALAIDDEQISLDYLTFQLKESELIDSVYSFLNPDSVLNWLETNEADVAFSDIIMDEMSGISLAQKIVEKCPKCKVIFVSSSKEYALDAFKLHASGYVVKPITKQEIEAELMHIMGDVKTTEVQAGVRIQCFGNFEVFISGRPVLLKYQKTKELLAYLVDRNGAACRMEEIASVLYADKEYNKSLQSLIRNLIADAFQAMKEADAQDVLVKERGQIAIVKEAVSCDYFDLQNGIGTALKGYRGEYMRQYAWAKKTCDSLNQTYHIV